jgi:uncharacterized membrane protein
LSGPDRPLVTKHPYRDSLLLNLVLAGLIVLISWATGGGLGRAVVFAILYFVLATAWSWWRFSKRLAEEQS